MGLSEGLGQPGLEAERQAEAACGADVIEAGMGELDPRGGSRCVAALSPTV